VAGRCRPATSAMWSRASSTWSWPSKSVWHRRHSQHRRAAPTRRSTHRRDTCRALRAFRPYAAHCLRHIVGNRSAGRDRGDRADRGRADRGANRRGGGDPGYDQQLRSGPASVECSGQGRPAERRRGRGNAPARGVPGRHNPCRDRSGRRERAHCVRGRRVAGPVPGPGRPDGPGPNLRRGPRPARRAGLRRRSRARR
jgi:hypothetical protein